MNWHAQVHAVTNCAAQIGHKLSPKDPISSVPARCARIYAIPALPAQVSASSRSRCYLRGALPVICHAETSCTGRAGERNRESHSRQSACPFLRCPGRPQEVGSFVIISWLLNVAVPSGIWQSFHWFFRELCVFFMIVLNSQRKREFTNI